MAGTPQFVDMNVYQHAKGLIHTAETHRKVSEEGKERVYSEETKQKMRESALRREAAKRSQANSLGEL